MSCSRVWEGAINLLHGPSALNSQKRLLLEGWNGQWVQWSDSNPLLGISLTCEVCSSKQKLITLWKEIVIFSCGAVQKTSMLLNATIARNTRNLHQINAFYFTAWEHSKWTESTITSQWPCSSFWRHTKGVHMFEYSTLCSLGIIHDKPLAKPNWQTFSWCKSTWLY